MKKPATYAVLGAFGKMGNGISTILLAAIATKEYASSGQITKNKLLLIDPNENATSEVFEKLKAYLLSHAEKNITTLRAGVAHDQTLIENHEIISDFVQKALLCVRVHNSNKGVTGCHYIFEAATEFEPLKIKLLTELRDNNPDAFFLTNTSSIPIQHLAKQTGLETKIIGYHFYNPPVKQKLLELVVPQNTQTSLVTAAEEFTKELKKTAIASNDIAGFIGNGHFMREVLFACETIQNSNGYDVSKMLQLDTISREALIRPMGIFQLIDYVGLDVCSSIMTVMTTHLSNETLDPKLINLLLAGKVTGGQHPNGTQKDGFFQYEKGKIITAYDMQKKQYTPIEDIPSEQKKPIAGWIAWKDTLSLSQEQKTKAFQTYFSALSQGQDHSSQLAMTYLKKSRAFAEHLVKSKVAKNMEDVNAVLELGFHHSYGPGNNYY